MKKVFISQPMVSKSDIDILEEREKAIEDCKRLVGEDIEVIDSFINDAPNDANPLWYLAKSIEFLSKADIAYFCPGWREARGCRIEHDCAAQYGITIIDPTESELQFI